MTTTHADYRLSQLDELEAESIHIFREVAAEFAWTDRNVDEFLKPVE